MLLKIFGFVCCNAKASSVLILSAVATFATSAVTGVTTGAGGKIILGNGDSGAVPFTC